MDCEVCGSAPATTKAKIEGVLFSVCSSCASEGKVVHEKPYIEKPLPYRNQSEPEETIVENCKMLIQQARIALGLRQDEFAAKLNEKLSVIQAVESGKREPDIALARKLEKFLRIKLVEVV